MTRQKQRKVYVSKGKPAVVIKRAELVWLIGNQRAEMKMLIAVSPWFKSVRVKGEMGNVLKRVELLFKEGRYEEIKHHARVKTAEKTKGMKGKIRSGAFWGVLLLQATWRQPELMASLFPELTQSCSRELTWGLLQNRFDRCDVNKAQAVTR